MQQTARVHLTYLAIALFGVMVLHDLWSTYRDVTVLPYSTFERLVDEGKIRKVVIETNRIRGELDEPIDGKHHFVTNRVDPELASRLEGKGVEFAGEIEDRLLPMLLSWIVPVLFFFGLWMLLMRRMAGRMGPGGGFLAVGMSKAKVYV
jgi:cell division protease FtsH